MLLLRHQTLETLKYGTSMIEQRLSRTSIKTMPCKLQAMDDQIMLVSQPLIADGGNFGCMLERTSEIHKTISVSMLKVEEIMKVKLFGLGEDTTVKISNGMSCILKI
jgi:hypothetical protein